MAQIYREELDKQAHKILDNCALTDALIKNIRFGAKFRSQKWKELSAFDPIMGKDDEYE